MSKRAGAPPTIIDVAREAGVSIKTVSRVLNKEASVHADTRAHVLQVVATLNYRPQLSARSLAGAKSFLIGLLYFDPSAWFVAGVQRGATQRCRESERHLVVESLEEDGRDPAPQLEQMLWALRPDGLVLTPPLCDDPRVLAALRANGTPCVALSPAGDDGHGLARVGMDDARAGAEVADLLVGLGHRRVAFVQGHQAASGRRQAGFERGLRAHGLALDPALVVPGRFEFEAGVEAAQALLARPEPPTAIFAGNDDAALGVLAAAQARGVRVPEALSIVGFDDSRAASLVHPGLTTVRQPVAEMAAAAIDLLVTGEARGAADGAVPVRVLPHALVVRGSTGPAPALD